MSQDRKVINMRLDYLYLGLCAAGAAVPLFALFPFVMEFGLDVSLFLEMLFSNPVSSMFGADVIISALTLILFVMVEGKRLGMKRPWLALLGLCIGVSLALPLFLYLRCVHKRQSNGS